jgi:hypothetical protein
MIKHIVLMRARPDMAATDLQAIFAELAALRGRLPGLRTVTFGRSDSPEKIERGYTHALMVDFDDWAALKVYAEDAAHKAAGAKLVAATQGGIDGLLVMDIPVEG